MDVRSLVPSIAQQEGIDPDLLMRVISAESGGNSDARSSRGAVGPAQLMPATARELGVDPADPVQNLRGGARYLKQQLDTFGSPELALAAYNAGPGAVKKAGGVPPFAETQAYVRKTMPQGSDDIFGFSGPAASAPSAPGSSDDIFGDFKPTAAQPTTPPQAVLAQAQPQGDGIGKQLLTGAREGLKPTADVLATGLGIPKWMQSDAFANTVLHMIGRPDMPQAAAPQNAGQSLARTGGRMLGAAVAPGSIPQRIASVVGPTVGSEGAGALFKDTPLEPAARFVGAALGGAAGGAIAGGVDAAQAAKANPRTTPAELRSQADAIYTELRNRDVQFSPDAVKSLHEGMSDVIGKLGSVYPSESNWVDTVANTLSQDPTVSTLDSLRSKMQKALTTPNGSRTPDQLRVGSQLVDEIDSFLNAAGRHPDVMTTAGDPAKAGQLLTQARDVWRRMRNVETVENLTESAGIRNATSHLGGNQQNFTGQKLRDFIDPTKNKSLSGLSDAEQQQLQNVVLGTPGTKALKIAGNLSPTKGIGALVNTVAAGMFGPAGPMVMAPLGFAANVAGGMRQKAQIEDLLRLLATPKDQQAALLASRPPMNPALRGAIVGGAMDVPQRTK